ncbi:HupE/UreJ family protein [Povalibacter sp.]|uniref:HupE/UreJ family protein n=1 Tax=Povalibacter sp. TaxID=1962978 RepID=UPI002F423694
MIRRILQWPLVTLLFASAACFAHKQSDSYLTLSVNGQALTGQWDIALRDLDFAIGLDADENGQITWGEVRQRRDAIAAYALEHLRIGTNSDVNSTCPLRAGELLIDEHVDGNYAVLELSGQCAASAARIGISYSLMAGVDPNHRGLLDLRSNGAGQSRVLVNDASPTWLQIDRIEHWQQFRTFVVEGVRHIWLGYDHILFLFTLLLPAVVIRKQGAWHARASLRESALDIVEVVTAFTLAHSLTLALAAVGVLQLPSRWVESAIAFTVLLGAANIVYPVVRERRWLLALGFGLIHGLGFASVLADLGLTAGNLIQALVGFNAGVELGQLAIVLALMPFAFMVRDTSFYRLLLPGGATVIGCLAVYWMVTRAVTL